MKKILKILTSLLLLFNGIGAFYGAGNFILHPDGSSMGMSLDWLKHTPFHDYFIPGIILFIVNGLFSFIALIAILINYQNGPRLVIAQGLLLTGWIVIQVLLIRTVYFLHIILGCVGMTLLILGWVQKQIKNAN